MSEMLKPCPFCGGGAHIKEVVSCCETVYSVGCPDSECMGFETLLCKPTPEEAIAAWNRRAERTCHVERVSTPYHAGPPRCSACMMPMEPLVNYCSYCGARVVSGDD